MIHHLTVTSHLSSDICLSVTDDGEERRSPSPGHSEGGDGVAPQREKYRPRSRTGFARSHSVTTYVFDEGKQLWKLSNDSNSYSNFR